MITVESLFDHPEHLDGAAEMIFKEFVQKKESSTPYSRIRGYLDKNPNDLYPVTFIALDDDKCVGTISIFESDLKERPQYTPWLASLYVENDYRNRGIAKRLIDHVITYARLQHVPKIYLKTDNASAYYERLGWTRVETIGITHPATDIFEYKLYDQ